MAIGTLRRTEASGLEKQLAEQPALGEVPIQYEEGKRQDQYYEQKHKEYEEKRNKNKRR